MCCFEYVPLFAFANKYHKKSVVPVDLINQEVKIVHPEGKSVF